MKLVEIASQLNVPDGTVRRWKLNYKWDNERSQKLSTGKVPGISGNVDINELYTDNEQSVVADQIEWNGILHRNRWVIWKEF